MILSIIIPTFNRAELILKTLDSIVNQSYRKYEIVIIDDASKDNTREIIDIYKNNNFDNEIIYSCLDKNLGPNVAKNLGIKLSKGDYLIFLDSDDTFPSNETLIEIKNEIVKFNSPELIMFPSNYRKSVTLKKSKKKQLNFIQFFKNPNIGECLPVVKKGAILKNMFFDHLRGGEGLTWQLITKESNDIILSSVIARNYDNVSTDRLSVLNKTNIDRILKIHQMTIKVLFNDFLKSNKAGLFILLMKIIYYKFLLLRPFLKR